MQGRQQQDSHELLRLLLDGLEQEELKAAGGQHAQQAKRTKRAQQAQPTDEQEVRVALHWTLEM